ncbi:MAG: hypothetical protein GWO16_08320, partial [Gammaproteobacteria bacterium]|nr:hypothetical protein [Gammaproteobacteria bacterium]NIR97952.1 hypothetical protein [Gammaproteobacteria bacterium]NIT63653.1 hypothetical protein [Gammaproteobacteria bacterium]NIV21511.1 hypothetical protein [Gammaproteobacteria bacterium]NIY32233.1 hypothetical protein [Gammaproteobacteria bacterium]
MAEPLYVLQDPWGTPVDGGGSTGAAVNAPTAGDGDAPEGAVSGALGAVWDETLSIWRGLTEATTEFRRLEQQRDPEPTVTQTQRAEQQRGFGLSREAMVAGLAVVG